jgi:hypothetical protein
MVHSQKLENGMWRADIPTPPALRTVLRQLNIVGYGHTENEALINLIDQVVDGLGYVKVRHD